MVKKIGGVVLFIWMALPSSLFAFSEGDRVCVTGAGTSSFNGEYSYLSSGVLRNSAGTHRIEFFMDPMFDDEKWYTLSDSGSNYYETEFVVSNTISSLVDATWTATSGDAAEPYPTITDGACGGGTPVPVGPLGILMLLAGILGSAFVGLRAKK